MTDIPTAKRNASTARRSRRDRHHYLAGYLAGVEAGLKEAVGLAYNHSHFVPGFDADEHDQFRPGSPYDRGRYEAQADIRARIAEIEGEAKTP